MAPENVNPDNPLVDTVAGRTIDQNGAMSPPSALGAAATTPFTDLPTVGGSPLPVPGAPSRPVVNGGASMRDILMSKGTTLPVVSSPHVTKIGEAAAETLRNNPESAREEGGGGRGLGGGAADGLVGGFDAVGDAAAVGTVPSGGGALVGLARTMQAGQQRQRQEGLDVQEAKNKEALRAETQARTIALAKNTYRQDQADRLSAYNRTASRMDELKKAGHTTTEKLSQSQFDELLKNNPGYLQTHTGGIVSEEPMMDPNGKQIKDQDGNLVYSPVYQLAEIQGADGQEGKKKLTPGESKYFKDYLGLDLPEGTELTTDQYLNQHVKAQGVEVAENAIIKANDDRLAQDNLRQVRTELSDPSVQRYVSMVPGDPLEGLNKAYKNIEDHLSVVDKQLDAAQKSGNAQMVQQLQQKKQQYENEEAKVNHVITFGFDDKTKEKYQTRIDEARKQTETERHNKEEERLKGQENAIKEAANDPEAIAPLIVDPGGNMDPSQLSKRASTYSAQLGAIDAYAKQKYGNAPSPDGYYDGTHFNIAKAQTDYKYANQRSTQNTLKYLNSLTGQVNPLTGKTDTEGNLDELVKKSNQVTRTQFPALNDVAAWTRLQMGDPKIVGYKTTVLEVADQVAKILQGGGTGSGTSDMKLKQAQEMFENGFTKDQIMEVANSLRPLLQNRRNSMIGDNRYLIRQFGKTNANASATPSVGDKKTFPNGKVGVWDGKGYVAQP